MRASVLYISLVILCFFLFILELALGSVSIPLQEVVNTLLNGEHINKGWEIIVLQTRLPRALAALGAGMFLALSGLFMQTLFRNPLAGPHILGVSSGAGLGVALVVLSTGGLVFGLFAELMVVLAAFAGALSVLFLLFIISLKVNDVLTVLIFGVLLGAIAMAIVGILQYMSTESQLKVFLIWTLGSFDGVTISQSLVMVLCGLPFITASVFLLKPLNLLLAGEENAQAMGLNIKKSRLWIMLVAGALTALATAFCGPIGFVGIVVPHFARMICKSFDHKKLLPISMLMGANVMLFADLVSHVPGREIILPINSITSLIGIPFIFWMLLKNKAVSQI